MAKNDELVMILDRSGSMGAVADDAIGGFNQLVQDLKEDSENTRMTLVQFDNIYETVFEGVKLKDVAPLTRKTYQPRGMTALLQSVHRAVKETRKRRRKSKGKTIVAIMTDGYENASKRKYTRKKVAKLVTKCQDDLGWEFLFLGANMDAFDEAHSIGISKSHAATYDNSRMGTRYAYAAAAMGAMAAMDDEEVDMAKTLKEVEDDNST